MRFIRIALGLCAISAYGQIDFILRVNASKQVTGSEQAVDWTAEKNAPIVIGGGSYLYSTMSSGLHDKMPGFVFPGLIAFQPWNYAGPTFPPQLAPTLLDPTPLNLNAPTPTKAPSGTNTTTYYSIPYFLRAAVEFPSGSDVTTTASNGGATSRFTYRIKVANTSGASKDYFLHFTPPSFTRSVTPAYNYCCSSDSNGGTTSYISQTSAASLSSFDVYADGLPVYSTTSTYSFPVHFDAYDYYGPFQGSLLRHTVFDRLENKFGDSTIWLGVKVYLGKLLAGQEVTVDLVMRSESKADAPNCGTSTFSGFGTLSLQKNCFELKEAVSIPKISNDINFAVYAKSL